MTRVSISLKQIQGTEKEGEVHEAVRDGSQCVQQWRLPEGGLAAGLRRPHRDVHVQLPVQPRQRGLLRHAHGSGRLF